MPRRDNDYDDDRPRSRRRRGDDSAATAMGIWIGLAIAALVVVVGVVILLVSRTGEAPADNPPNAERKQPTSPAVRGENWKKVIGSWERTRKENETSEYPYRFDFRADMTATMTRFQNNRWMTQEATVDILVDERDSLRMRLLMAKGLYGYWFRLGPDDTLLLPGREGTLAYSRVK